MKRLFLGAAAALAAACAGLQLPFEMGNPKWGLDVIWHGHSSFTLRDSLDRTIVLDPFNETVGYGRLRLVADALLVSHRHFDHAFKTGVRPRRRVDLEMIDSTGTYTVASGLVVNAISSDHDAEGGQIHGKNRIFVFTMGGLRCVHLGDFGQRALTPHQREMIGKVDVLFVPVGGVTTLGAAQAKAVVDVLKPGAVFPMHYGDIRFYRLEPVDGFLALFPPERVHRHKESRVRLRADELGPDPEVHVLQPTPKNI